MIQSHASVKCDSVFWDILFWYVRNIPDMYISIAYVKTAFLQHPLAVPTFYVHVGQIKFKVASIDDQTFSVCTDCGFFSFLLDKFISQTIQPSWWYCIIAENTIIKYLKCNNQITDYFCSTRVAVIITYLPLFYVITIQSGQHSVPWFGDGTLNYQ